MSDLSLDSSDIPSVVTVFSLLLDLFFRFLSLSFAASLSLRISACRAFSV